MMVFVDVKTGVKNLHNAHFSPVMFRSSLASRAILLSGLEYSNILIILKEITFVVQYLRRTLSLISQPTSMTQFTVLV